MGHWLMLYALYIGAIEIVNYTIGVSIEIPGQDILTLASHTFDSSSQIYT